MNALAKPYDVSAIRKDFAILGREVYGKKLVYLDNAASAQKPEAVIEARELPAPSVYAHQIAFNVLPHVETFKDGDDYTTEERKCMRETRKILGREDIGVSATCVRVPVYTGHSVSANVQTREPLSPEDCRELLAAAPGIAVVDDPAHGLYPTPLDAAGGAYEPFRLSTEGIAPLELLSAAPLTFDPESATIVRWRPPAAASSSRIVVRVSSRIWKLSRSEMPPPVPAKFSLTTLSTSVAVGLPVGDAPMGANAWPSGKTRMPPP